MSMTMSTDFSRKRSLFMIAPVLAIPFLCGAFYALGGGKGGAADPKKEAAGMGFNMELPKPKFDPKESKMNKLGFYKKADEDSVRRREYRQLDPYQRRTVAVSGTPGIWHTSGPSPTLGRPVLVNGVASPEDPKADELLKRLEGLKRVMAHSQETEPSTEKRDNRMRDGGAMGVVKGAVDEPARPIRRMPVDTAARDPELERINEMLDKIIRIQHPGVGALVTDTVAAMGTDTVAGMRPADTLAHERNLVAEVGRADKKNLADRRIDNMAATTLPAVVEGKQKLVAGATIALRLTEEVLIDGIRLPRDQLLYGNVSIHNDRMGVHIGSIRSGLTLYTVSIEVYDMDGQPGIHIKDLSLKQVTKESADLGVGSLNLMGYDPTIGGQAANAGLQAVKSLFRRKVRPVRVVVKNGYPILLRDMKAIR
jgi:hypothetical protein